MKYVRNFLANTLAGGLLVVLPVYLSLLLLIKAGQGLLALLGPVEKLLPAWVVHSHLSAMMLVLVVCFLAGLWIRSSLGNAFRSGVGLPIFSRIPGYDMFSSLAKQLAGQAKGSDAWQPAMAEIEDALVPAFIIETHVDGRLTVFVPSVPTPFAGAVYILTPDRVHIVNVPFTHAVRAISHWGEGCKELVAAIQPTASRSIEPV
jgi:uncharacterized membrane protein